MTNGKKHESDPCTAGDEPLTYEKWCSLPQSERPRVPIIVSFDMGWQRRGFCSISGHAFMIGGRSGKVLCFLVCAKECGKCNDAQRQGRAAKKHPCPHNYEGSSKGMEADAALLLTVEMFDAKM